MTTDLSIPNRQLPNDMRTALMATPAESLPAKLHEIELRRTEIRKWMLSQMQPGVHFGVPPGVNQTNVPGRWESKPSLYQSGADFVIEAENLRPEFVADEAAARMLGNLPNMLIYACKLYSRTTGELLGEGRGACKIDVSDKQKMDALNKGVKMACKRAKVAAVLNTYGLSDLFTQDLEDAGPPPPSETTEQSPSAAKAKPRTERVTGPECKAVLQSWKKSRMANAEPCEVADFELWVSQLTGMHRSSVGDAGSWTRQNLDDCWADLGGQP